MTTTQLAFGQPAWPGGKALEDAGSVSRLGLVVRRSAGERKDAGSVSRLGLVVRRSAGGQKDADCVSRLGLVVRLVV